jgi:threonyl-tRNA synthetase
VRASRQRRDCVIAVIGDDEVDGRTVQVTDVATNFRGSVASDELVDVLSRSYANRDRVIDWTHRQRASR